MRQRGQIEIALFRLRVMAVDAIALQKSREILLRQLLRPRSGESRAGEQRKKKARGAHARMVPVSDHPRAPFFGRTPRTVELLEQTV